MAERMTLYHTSYQIIREPDVRYGRKNADFGQGFYLSPAGGLRQALGAGAPGRAGLFEPLCTGSERPDGPPLRAGRRLVRLYLCQPPGPGLPFLSRGYILDPMKTGE